MSEIIYLGRVRLVRESFEKNYRHAIVEPLVQSSEDQKRWIGSIDNPLDNFPARGYVFWHDAPKGLEEGDVRQFDIEPHPYYKGESDKDAYTVRNHKYPMEIIDLRDIGSERNIRILLTTTGVFLNDKPLVERCVLWIQEEKWVGPVNLTRRIGTSSWTLSPKQGLDTIRCTKIPLEAIQQIDLDGTRYLLAPNQDNLGPHIGFVNWEADEVLAKRVFNRLLKRDRKTAEALKITKEVFRTYMETIEHAGLVGANLAQELAFHERIEEVLTVISKNDELLEEAANVCFSIDPVKEMVEEKAEEEFQKKLLEHQNRLNEELSIKKAELKDVADSLSAEEKDLTFVKGQIQALNEKLDERVSGFEAELEKRLCDLSEKPERLFAEMAIAKGIVARNTPTLKKPPTASRKKLRGRDPEMPIIQEPSVLMSDLAKRLLRSRISPVVGYALHSTLLAGLIPVLIGPEAYDVVSAYADCLSGGKIHWIPVGGSVFEPSDLIARFDPNSRCLVPHPGGLIDLLVDESDAMRVVLLDGFNRAAVDGYLIPLLCSALDVARGRKARSIPLAPAGFVSNENAYEGISSISWNRNVLLMLCPATGASTLPVPEELWNHCTALDASDPALVEVPPESKILPQETMVPATIWKVWSEDAKSQYEPLDMLRERPKESGTLSQIALYNVESIYWSWKALGLEKEEALARAVKTSLFPYLVATKKPIDVWLQHLGLELDEIDQRINETVRRLGE